MVKDLNESVCDRPEVLGVPDELVAAVAEGLGVGLGLLVEDAHAVEVVQPHVVLGEAGQGRGRRGGHHV